MVRDLSDAERAELAAAWGNREVVFSAPFFAPSIYAAGGVKATRLISGAA